LAADPAAKVHTERQHWAYVRPERPPLPDVEKKDWPHTPIDSFILARLEREGLAPSAAANPVTLARRRSSNLFLMKVANASDDSGFYFRSLQDDIVPENIRAILDLAPQQRAEDQKKALVTYYHEISPVLERKRAELKAVKGELREAEKPLRHCLLSVPATPRVVRVLPRGNWMDESGAVVEPAIPRYFGTLGIEGRRATRLDLARWFVSPENPMTARAFVNRLWKLFFGTGISKNLDDLGAIALASLAHRNLEAGTPTSGQLGVLPGLHGKPKAKRVIFLVMAGGASHLETFDYKPKLDEMRDQPMPESITAGQPIAQLQGAPLTCFAPQHPFRKWGQAGQEICEILPHIGSIADDICIIRSMRTEQINHDPAHTFMNTGTSISGRPSMGSWLWYGLRNECDNLPGFVVMVAVGCAQDQLIASRQWQAGFLPSSYQGVQFQSKGEPVLYLDRPPGVDAAKQRDVIDAVQALNHRFEADVNDPEITTRIGQYEMAFKMQVSVPELVDFSGESKETLDLYGVERPDGSFASNCLLARRMAERGVRFVQLYHRGWDHHGGIKKGIVDAAGHVDRGAAALVRDLKQRGMLEDTLVVWGGEFGRTPMEQGGTGSDHRIKGFSWWLAGGGVKGGTALGATDDFGYNAVEDVVHMHDFHATMLHLLGVDHLRLTYPFQGRDFRLTDVHGNVIHKILA
jgi:hypothetical protein